VALDGIHNKADCGEAKGIMKTVERLFEETNLSVEEVAERAGLDFERVAAIAEGRWTPSPEERDRVAVAFGVPVGEISWGHSMNPRNIRYRRFGLRENF
jgi:transcriptional regulator with XRE-family HTH domain